ncbi:MAG: hypothetical protein M9894_31660 [Planctomycetes bacterium]|nr:hypothetical protein [Planctomycetota bacterium]
MDAEDVIVHLFLLAVSAGGLLLFWLATEKGRVLLSSRAWPAVEAVVTSARLVESTSTRRVSDTSAVHRGPDVEVRHDAWGAGGDVKTTSVAPHVSFRFELGEEHHVVSNQDAAWNHRFSYSRDSAAATLQRFAPKTTHLLRANPRAPKEVFIAAGQFPWIWTPIEWVLGFFLGVAAFVAAVKPLILWAAGDDQGHETAQKVMVGLACLSPIYAVGRAALDAIRRR